MSEVFTSYCRNLEKRLPEANNEDEAIAIVSSEIKGVLADPSFLLPFLKDMAEDAKGGDFRAADYNDITLHRSPDGIFSVRLFVWEANVPYPIHDHGSWGVVGCLSGQIRLTRYYRQDKETAVDSCLLLESGRAILKPGDITIVYPLDRGIHHMETLGEQTALSLHTYGKPIRKGYIRAFLPQNNSVYRIYSPKYLSRVIALKALSSLDTTETAELLDRYRTDGPPLLAEEARLMKKNRKEGKR